MADITSLHSLILELPPSCIEFWPVDDQYAVIGTYNLEKGNAEGQEAGNDQNDNEEAQNGTIEKRKQERNGSLILIKVAGDEIQIIQTLPTPSAILDLHFAPSYQDPSVFGVATSTGSFSLYRLTTASSSSADLPQLTHIHTFQFFPQDALITAFSWHPTLPIVGMTLSNTELHLGLIHVLSNGEAILETSNVPEDENAERTLFVHQHSLEAWTLAFPSSGNCVYSGGDDSALMYRALPATLSLSYSSSTDELHKIFISNASIDDVEDEPGLSWADKRTHGAGVTAILPLSLTPNTSVDSEQLIVTGSYDDTIRLLSISPSTRRKVLTDLNLGGGVWRLKLLSSSISENQTEVLLLVSCMHAGTRIVRLAEKDGEWAFEVLARFEEHKSMNYGSDCQKGVDGEGKRTFVSTSFYDRLVCLWRF